MEYWQEQYNWLVQEMKERVGEPPKGVSYPVWAWYMWEGARKKPDLRQKRWRYGWKGDRFACMEIDIPEENLVLSDFDSWSIILLNGLLADTEEEDKSLERECEAMSPDAQKEYKYRNWKNVFDLTYVDNNWMHKGDSIQATFWELRKEDIKRVRFFTAASPKPKYLEVEVYLSEKLFASARVQYPVKERRPQKTMHDWNQDGKIDLRDGFIQDEIESRNSGSQSTGSGSGSGCITILLVPIIILFLYAIVKSAPSGVFSLIFFLFVVAVLIGKLVS